MAAPIYTRLVNKDCIRVLGILPSSKQDDEVVAEFYVQSLSEDPSPGFEALSYMWGDQTVRATIALNARPFSISKHLHGAIQTLRDHTKVRYLWIDAICINQNDIQERNEQVGLMRNIYQRAKAVLVWLDKEIDSSHASFQKLQRLSEKSELSDLGRDPDLWSPVYQMFKDPYWSRVWIQQEITNASAIRLFCRDAELSIISIFHLIRLFEELQLEDIMKTAWWNWMERKPDITLPSRFGLVDSHLQPLVGTTLGEDVKDILDILSGTAKLKCTDDRDRVYGIMFLAPDYQDGGIKVDYHHSLPQVYTEVVRYIMTKYRSTRFLLYSTMRSISDPSAAIPSWVPDWRNPSQRYTMARVLPPLSPPLVSSLPSPLPRISGTTLSLLGIRIDTIHTSYQQPFTSLDLLSQTITQFTNTCTTMANHAIQLSQHLPPDTPPPALDVLQTTPEWKSLIRTLALHDNRDPRRDDDDMAAILYLSAAELIKLSLEQANPGWSPDTARLGEMPRLDAATAAPALAYTFVQFAWLSLVMTAPFLGGTGRVGMAPRAARAGDEVWLVPGCEGVVVLRRRAGGRLVVGEGYLDGERFWEGVRGWRGVDEVREGEEIAPGRRVEVLEMV